MFLKAKARYIDFQAISRIAANVGVIIDSMDHRVSVCSHLSPGKAGGLPILVMPPFILRQ